MKTLAAVSAATLGLALFVPLAHAVDWIERAQVACSFAKSSDSERQKALALVLNGMKEARRHEADGANGHSSILDDAAASVAASVILDHLFPDQQPEFEMNLAVAVADIPESQAKADALARGRRVAERLIRGLTPN